MPENRNEYMRDKMREYRKENPGRGRARQKAMVRLAWKHPREFKKLFEQLQSEDMAQRRGKA